MLLVLVSEARGVTGWNWCDGTPDGGFRAVKSWLPTKFASDFAAGSPLQLFVSLEAMESLTEEARAKSTPRTLLISAPASDAASLAAWLASASLAGRSR